MRLRRPRLAMLRTRVLAGVLLVTLAGFAAFDVAGVTALRRYLTGQTDSQLRTVLSLHGLADLTIFPSAASFTHANFAQRRPGQLRPSRPGTTAPAGRRPSAAAISTRLVSQAAFLYPFTVTLVNSRRTEVMSPAVTIKGIPIGKAGPPEYPVPRFADIAGHHPWGQGWTTGSGRYSQTLRMMAMPDPGQGILVATTSLGGVNKTVGQLELILIIGSACAGLLAAGGVAWIMRRGLRPIETMAGQADAITAGDLTDRVGTRDPRTEVGRLGTAINGMLGRIGASQEASRQFFADASHELRTPLASLRANAELYQQGALTRWDQVDEAMRRITLEAQRMGGLVDDLLRLARLDQHPGQQREPVDLTALVTECAQRARTTDPRRAWRTEIAAGLEVAGDEELLRRAMDNLLANVRAHTPDDATATVTAERRGGCVVIEVSDNGPGVPPGQLPRIFDRFYRAATPARRPGSGLGLAIVAAVAAAHDGQAEASPADPHGLRITLILPAPAGAAAAKTASAEASEGSR